MKKISFGFSHNELGFGLGYQWDNANMHSSTEPILDIEGTGRGWAKETNGPVKITGTGHRTVVRITGAGGWKINGPESITG